MSDESDVFLTLTDKTGTKPGMILTEMKTIFIIDDHPLYRAGLKAVIENGMYHITGEAGTAKEGIRLARKLKPDIAVVNLHLPDRLLISLIKKMTDMFKKTYIIIITAYSEATFVIRAVNAGAKGYLLRDSDIGVFLKCLDSVSKGRQYIDISLFSDSDFVREHNDRYYTLSDREQDVMRLIAENYSAKTIAMELGITLNTVKSHRTSVYGKIGVKDKAGLIRYAAMIGLADPDRW